MAPTRWAKQNVGAAKEAGYFKCKVGKMACVGFLVVCLVLLSLTEFIKTEMVSTDHVHELWPQMLTRRVTAGVLPRPVEFEWCKAKEQLHFAVAFPPFQQEMPELTPFRIRTLPGSGACSVLVGILDVVMYATSMNRSFFLDERLSKLAGNLSWYSRYFEAIGLQGRNLDQEPFIDTFYTDDVLKFSRSDRITIRGETLPKIQMKQRFVRKFWQFQPWVQERICPMVTGLQLHHPYIAMQIRRGDKHLENRMPIPLHTLVEYLNTVTWNGLVTTEVFVAMDDCRVLAELEAAAPRYTFKSLCHVYFGLGWNIAESVKEDLTEHYMKLFGDLMAMAAADIFLGDSWSNLYHWAFYMRSENSGNFTVYDMRSPASVM